MLRFGSRLEGMDLILLLLGFWLVLFWCLISCVLPLLELVLELGSEGQVWKDIPPILELNPLF